MADGGGISLQPHCIPTTEFCTHDSMAQTHQSHELFKTLRTVIIQIAETPARHGDVEEYW